MQRKAGFSLIEVMTAMVVALILAAIAYPSYARYMVRLRRVEAQAGLLQILQDQERYYTLHNAYLPFSADSADEDARHFRWWLGNSAAHSAYELSGRSCDGLPLTSCIELRAEPGTGRVDSHFRDPGCGVLKLTSAGQHSAEGSETGCWP
ncbi:MAG: type IV pilin protein [Massilia sp.]